MPIEYLSTYVSYAHLGVIRHWLENGADTSPAEMADILSRLTLLGPGYVSGLMRN